MSPEDDFSNSSVSEVEMYSDKANLRIFLVDPTGGRPPELWISDQGRSAKYDETFMARILRIFRRR